MKEIEFCEKVYHLGGKAYIVGGWVRDLLRGVVAHDKDYALCGLCETDFVAAFPEAIRIGKSFPVYLLTIDGAKCEVAFARSELKSGEGYRGFSVVFTPEITIEEDLYRRDSTMNSIAYDVLTKEMIDPYQGSTDIAHKVIRAVSKHFVDDPVRALRAARQAAQFGFTIDEQTIGYMRQCRREIQLEPKERLVGELEKALSTDMPSKFFYALGDAELLDVTFPHIYALLGKIQPKKYHPEGDAFVHTMQVLDAVALMNNRIEVRFAALVHDIGKGVTPAVMLPHHYGHEKRGTKVLAQWNQSMTLPRNWIKCADFVIKEHMRVNVMTHDGKIVDFIVALAKNPIGIDGFSAIIQADNGNLPDCLRYYSLYWDKMRRVCGNSAPAGLSGNQIGAWVRNERLHVYQQLKVNK